VQKLWIIRLKNPQAIVKARLTGFAQPGSIQSKKARRSLISAALTTPAGNWPFKILLAKE
jgi:hypothetical protein